MTAPETMTDCPNEDLAAFIDGRLTGPERTRVIEHIAGCGECREFLLMAKEIQAEAASSVPVISELRRNRVYTYASLAAAAVLILIVGSMWKGRWQSSDEMDALVKASASLSARPSLARLSGAYPYRRTFVARGGSESGRGSLDDLAILRIANEVEAKAGKTPSPAQRHVLGVSYLLLGQPETAMSHLQQALIDETSEPDILRAIEKSPDAQLLNDLAATYHTLIERRDKQELQGPAVAATQKAWSLQRTPEIAWTRAVIFESIHAKDRAIAAWKDYLALDRDSEWRAEAEQRLNELQLPTDAERWPAARAVLLSDTASDAERLRVVDAFRQETRLLCEDMLLPAWGNAILRGDSSAAQQLVKITTLGRLLNEVNEEHDVIDAAEAVRTAKHDDLIFLARGHVAYGAARKAIIASVGDTAMRESEVAVAALTPERTPFSWRARVEHAGAQLLISHYAQALAEIESLRQPAAPYQPSGAYRARLEWVSGRIRVNTGPPDLVIASYVRASEIYQANGERDYESSMRSQLAAAYEHVGNSREAAKEREAAQEILQRTGNRPRLHFLTFEAAFAAIRRDESALATLLLDTTVENDVASGDSFNTCTSTMWRGAYRRHLGLLDGAAEDLQNARRACEKIPDPAERELKVAYLALAQASLRPDQATPVQIEDLDASVAFLERTGDRRWLGTAYLARARARVAQAQLLGAEEDFRAALAEVRETRAQIAERDARLSFTATADDVTDSYVGFLLDEHREREAFEVADASRSRELVDSVAARWHGTSPPVLEAAQRSLPPEVGVVEYRVVGDHIVAWAIDRRTFQTVRLAVSRDAVSRMVGRITNDASELQFSAATAPLYDALIAPVEPFLQNATALIIIPDDELELISYAALYDQSRQRYLFETRASTLAASLSLFLESAQRYDERIGGEDRLLVIAAAGADATADALPAATKETQSLAALFRNVKIVGSNSTTVDLLSGASEATVVHFVGHGLRGGEGTKGVLRIGDSETARLDEEQVATASLPHVRLVYLSSCESDAGPVLKSEGSVTIARSFFAAGVPAVVATLWRVDDSIARQIAHSFYEQLCAGSAPGEALRRAQLDVRSLMKGSRPDWAAFRIIGAGAPVQRSST